MLRGFFFTPFTSNFFHFEASFANKYVASAKAGNRTTPKGTDITNGSHTGRAIINRLIK